MPDRSPSDIPVIAEKEVRDWHPDEGPNEEVTNVSMSAEQGEALQNYVNTLRDMLNLNHWDVFIALAASDPSTNASIHPTYGRYVASMALNQNFLSYSPHDQRNTIVHELLHLMHNSQTELIRTTPTSNWLWVTFERETELMVDHLASAIDVLFPLPEFPKDSSGIQS